MYMVKYIMSDHCRQVVRASDSQSRSRNSPEAGVLNTAERG